MKHTPGPWHVGSEDVSAMQGSMGLDILTEENRLVAEATTLPNAELIAASPDQHLALIALCHEFEQVVAVPTAFTAYNDAQAAIAKADGSSTSP